MTIRKSANNNGASPIDTFVGSEEEGASWQGEHDVHTLSFSRQEEAAEGAMPASTRIGGNILTKNAADNPTPLPSSLQIGPAEVTPRSSFESLRSKRSASPIPASSNFPEKAPSLNKLASNNPFLHHMGNPASMPTSAVNEESSANIWATGTEERAWYSQDENSSVPQSHDQTATMMVSQSSPHSDTLPAVVPEIMEFEKVPPDAPLRDPRKAPFAAPPAQQGHSSSMSTHTRPAQGAFINQPETLGISQADTVNEGQRNRDCFENEKDLPPLPPRNLIDVGPALPPRRAEQPEEQPPSQPPRPRVDTIAAGADASSRAQAELDRRKKQRSETYPIRLVNWFDASSSINPRRSPVMVQNANGPCPLLALVNALVLSTPSGLETALLDTLERREQVSLGLLLDAVIDELMSGRRGDAAQNLPDVSDLYAFLVNLHTGMNVNPCFLSKEPEVTHLMDAPIEGESASFSSVGNAGSFENTREMRLYSTFAVPLIHGWIPSNSHPACAALERSAKTYEDAQNLMFAEEELENKLSREGLDQDEQRLLQDIASVKYFLSSSATQLTAYGLDQIMKSLRPGSIAILFRNDHFSTLYRHPRSGQLFTLVTDMGYAGHDEVVWESLVDISGEGSGFFAGDFRPVGNNTPLQGSALAGEDNGWTTVRRSNPNGKSQSYTPSTNTTDWATSAPANAAPDLSSLHLEESARDPTSPKAEQEDHDLALALQLQEEEEERERQETASRRREDELSQTFVSSQHGSRGRGTKRGLEIKPSIPPRGNTSGLVRGGAVRGGLRSNGRGGTSSTESRVAVQPDDGEDAPPPSYDQAASGPAYHPPPNHPAHPNAFSRSPSSSARAPNGLQRQSSAYTQNSSGPADSPIASSPSSAPFAGSPSTASSRFSRNSAARTGGGRGASGVEGAPGVYRRNGREAVDEADRSRDCTLM